jgi:oligopeptide/dipeptide ABC transporter ATP-binding protein
MPSAIAPPSGCRFHTRCPFAIERCRTETPVLAEYEPGRSAACHRAGEAALWN